MVHEFKGPRVRRRGVLSWKGYGTEDPWFCDDAAAALTGLKYGCAIASLAVNRSWPQD